MKFGQPLVKGTIQNRYKRFLADVVLEDGTEIVAHCANTGSMKTCWSKGDTIYLTYHDNPKRKLKYSWEFTVVQGGMIGINTARPNAVVDWAINSDQIPELVGYDKIKREVKYGSRNSRVDLLLERGNEKCYVEVKNATLYDSRKDLIVFPDAVTERGLKHLLELEEMVKSGHRAVLFFLVNRPEGDAFSIAGDIDPKYAETLEIVASAGVEVLAYRAEPSMEGITIGKRVDVQIDAQSGTSN